MNVGGCDVLMLPKGRAPRLLYAVTAPISASVLLRGQLAYMRKQGFDVHVVSSPGKDLLRAAEREGVVAHPVPMCREVSIVRDCVSLWRLWCLFVRLRPEIVNASTAKAGLLAAVASLFAAVPCRMYVLRGLRSETLKGFKHAVQRLTERIACACAQLVICISPSLRRLALELGVVSEQKSLVLGAGSSNGVEAGRFLLTPGRLTLSRRLRAQHGIPAVASVVGFVGRLTRDKGIAELVEACTLLRPRFPSLRLLLVGPFEDGDPVDPLTRQAIEAIPWIVAVGRTEDVVPYYHTMDVLAFPTHREGFGNASIEAAAASKPVVTTDATGAKDSVVDGVTGFIVPKGNAGALADALGRLLENPELAHKMGQAGQGRTHRDFRPEEIWAGLERVYRKRLRMTNLLSVGHNRPRAGGRL